MSLTGRVLDCYAYLSVFDLFQSVHMTGPLVGQLSIEQHEWQ
jgi:hypothetical protein